MPTKNNNTRRDADIRRKRATGKRSLQSLADEYGLTRERIRQIVGATPNVGIVRAQQRLRRVIELYHAGLSDEKIAARVGLSLKSVALVRGIAGLRRNGSVAERAARGVFLCYGPCGRELPLEEKSGNICRDCNRKKTRRRFWSAQHGTEPPDHDGRTVRHNAERDAEIVRRRKSGAKLKTIAAEFGLSHMRVWKICKEALDKDGAGE